MVINSAGTNDVLVRNIDSLNQTGNQQIERKDPTQGVRLRAWLEGKILTTFKGRLTSLDVDVARRCAGLHVPDPRSERDAIIAASALAHDMTVVTRNVSDFESTGVNILNPWERHTP